MKARKTEVKTVTVHVEMSGEAASVLMGLLNNPDSCEWNSEAGQHFKALFHALTEADVQYEPYSFESE